MSHKHDEFDGFRREADTLREPFSPSLHARVMRRVKDEPIAPIEPVLAPASWRRPVLAGFAVAVVLTTATAVWWKSTLPVTTPGGSPAQFVNVTGWIGEAITPLREKLDEPLPAMAYLDQDAASFGQFVVRQLDPWPAPAAPPVSPPRQ